MTRPQVIVETRDWIAKHLLLRWQKEGEIRKHLVQRTARQICFVGRTAPDVIARIDWLHVGQDRSPYTGADTIAANEDGALLNPPAREMNANAGAILLEALKVPAEVVMGWINGVAQHPLQPIPGGEDLRQVFFADHAPGPVERDALIDFDTKVAGTCATFLQGLQKLRMHGDTGAATDQFDR